jgi:hypothetical protein
MDGVTAAPGGDSDVASGGELRLLLMADTLNIAGGGIEKNIDARRAIHGVVDLIGFGSGESDISELILLDVSRGNDCSERTGGSAAAHSGIIVETTCLVPATPG